MKNQIKLVILGVFAVVMVVSLFTAIPTYATVGGETFIHNFTYNPTNESVYYIMQNAGGRGCPPELLKLSLASGKTDIVYSCDDGEKAGYEYGSSGANDEINKMIEGLKPLTPLSLKANHIAIDVTFTSADSENYSPDTNEVFRRHFTASVYQNNKKVSEFPIVGCNITQPFLFQGYAIPGFDKKIVLLLSTKGDCFEGGYIGETLHVVSGLANLDRSQMTNFYKGNSALTPNEGNLVVYEADKVSIATDTDSKSDSQTQSKKSIVLTIGISIITLLIGLLLGKLVYKKS